MEIRKAQKPDIDEIEKIYSRIHDEEEKGTATIGWMRDIYPTRKTAECALIRDDLFVIADNGEITASAIINQTQVPEYKNASWKYNAEDRNVMVLHTLVVDPLKTGSGYGRAFVAFYENWAKQHNCSALRMDTNEKNRKARKLYQTLGYKEIDVVSCVFNGIPDVRLVCLEKYLSKI